MIHLRMQFIFEFLAENKIGFNFQWNLSCIRFVFIRTPTDVHMRMYAYESIFSVWDCGCEFHTVGVCVCVYVRVCINANKSCEWNTNTFCTQFVSIILENCVTNSTEYSRVNVPKNSVFFRAILLFMIKR